MGKRGRDGDAEEAEPPRVPKEQATVGQRTSHIRNKQRRSELYDQLRHKAAVAKKKARVKRQAEVAKAYEAGLEPPTRQAPKTIDNTREKDPTVLAADDEDAAADAAEDEFAAHFSRAVAPSLLVTTCRRPHARTFAFLSNLLETLPSATYYARKAFSVAQIVSYASAAGFTNVAFFNEGRKFSKGARVDALLLVHLPSGPTAHFRLSGLTLTRDISGHGRPSPHIPELILNNFTTAVGHRVGRLLGTLLPPAPQFAGRRVVTLHNQRDFIFFRHHRYVFEESDKGGHTGGHTGHLAPAVPPRPAGVRERRKKKKGAAAAGGAGGEGAGGGAAAAAAAAAAPRVAARLQELGPRFTLRLQSLQRGLFDPRNGEYEWVRPPPGSAAGASRRRFAL